MDHFNYRDGELCAEQVPLQEIAFSVGTPAYIYSRATMERHWCAFDNAFGDFPHKIYYAVKANGNLGVLSVFARLGSGFDIVSIGELERVVRAGGNASDVVFSGVGKSAVEIRQALTAGVACLNVESASELKRVETIAAEVGKTAPISVRVNPDVDAQTHPYISTGLKENKFGVASEDVLDVYRFARDSAHLQVTGIACHIGSQLTDTEPYVDAIDKVLDLVDELEKLDISLEHIDIGGGLGIRYQDEKPPLPDAYAEAVIGRFKVRNRHTPICIEPGRAIMGNAGILLTKVEYLKHGQAKNFAIVDAAMNDLIRPSLYQAWQEIVPVNEYSENHAKVYDVVGPVCETGDYLGKERELTIAEGDFLAVRSAGAYGAVMSSNYNARPRPAEVLVDGAEFHVVRQREDMDDMVRGELTLPP